VREAFNVASDAISRGTGKTTTLKAIVAEIPRLARVVTIEEAQVRCTRSKSLRQWATGKLVNAVRSSCASASMAATLSTCSFGHLGASRLRGRMTEEATRS